jgi:hypothetical protein
MSSARISVDVQGVQETLKAFGGLEADLRKEANAELRQAAKECASALVALLVAAAGASGVPVAQRVAASIKVKSDRIPVVSIGGPRRVGRRGAPAAALLWGSETGPAGPVNHFGVPRNAGGYWIAPTVEKFATNKAPEIYRRKVYEIMRKWGLV